MRSDCQICPAPSTRSYCPWLCIVSCAGSSRAGDLSLVAFSPPRHGKKICQLIETALDEAAVLLTLWFKQGKKALVQICSLLWVDLNCAKGVSCLPHCCGAAGSKQVVAISCNYECVALLSSHDSWVLPQPKHNLRVSFSADSSDNSDLEDDIILSLNE